MLQLATGKLLYSEVLMETQSIALKRSSGIVARHPSLCLVTVLLSRLILAVLIVIPSLTYFSKVNLFTFAGIDVNVRFVLLLTVLSATGLTLFCVQKVKVPRLFLLVFIFVAWGTIVAIFQSVPVRWWLPPFLRLTTSGLIAIATYNLTIAGLLDIESFQRHLYFALSVPLIVGMVQAVLGLAPLMNGAYRVWGTFNKSPVGYALFLAGLGILLFSQRDMSLVSIAYLVAVFVMVLTTHSRQSMVAFVVTIIGVGVLQKRAGKVLKVLLLLVPFLFIFSGLTSQFLGRMEHLLTINKSVLREAPSSVRRSAFVIGGADNSTLLRLHTIMIGLELFKENPICGYGFGSFVTNYEKITGRVNIAAHNDYLKYLVETGIIGMGIVLFLQLSVTRTLLKRLRRKSRETSIFAKSVAGAYFAINVLCFLSNPYYFYEVQFWIWAGIGVALASKRPNIIAAKKLQDLR